MQRPTVTLAQILLGGLCLVALPAPADAEQVGRESDITDLRLGQRIFVDDGSCPAGQIKQVTGAKLSTAGVVRRIVCVARPGSHR